MRAIPDAIYPFLIAQEGCKLTAYTDSKGRITIGVGHTGPDVHPGLTWTQKQADDCLRRDVSAARAGLYSVLKPQVFEPAPKGLTDPQFAALLSFVFNTGTHDKAGKPWTMWSLLNKGQYDAIPAQLARFVNVKHDGGTVEKIKGLVNRRNAEIALWSTAEPGSTEDEAPPSGETRAAETPPSPVETTPVHRQPAVLATASAAVLGAPAAIKTVSDTVSPYAQTSHYVQTFLEWLATAGAGAAVLGVAVLWLKSKQAKQ
jgi:lysozyme